MNEPIEIAAKDNHRFSAYISQPLGKPKGGIEVADYVLQNFDEEEFLNIEKITKNITDSMSILIEKKLDLFSSTVNNKK